jgi:HPt (histidine-containing phosphotransfer) domain-containing protein
MLAEADFDVLILDSRMPRLDGIDVLRVLRAGQRGVRNPALPVIACTANAGAEERRRFLAEGANGFLPKPIDEAALHAAIADVIAARMARPSSPQNDVSGPDSTPRTSTGGIMIATTAMRLAFINEGPRMVTTLRTALAEGDAHTAARAAHGLKGSAAYFGAHRLQALAHQAEQAADAGQLNAAADTFNAIAREMDALLHELRTHVTPQDARPPMPESAGLATADPAALQVQLALVDALLARQSLDAESALATLRTQLPDGEAHAVAAQVAAHLTQFDFAAAKSAMNTLRHALETPP